MSLTGSWRECYALGRYVFYIIPRTAWLYYTGQLEPPAIFHHRLPVRLVERGWCSVCQRVLETASVRCLDHPEAEVMIVLRDESVT